MNRTKTIKIIIAEKPIDIPFEPDSIVYCFENQCISIPEKDNTVTIGVGQWNMPNLFDELVRKTPYDTEDLKTRKEEAFTKEMCMSLEPIPQKIIDTSFILDLISVVLDPKSRQHKS